jgi:hypothetical protein
VKSANVFGRTGDDERGTWCTPKWLAEYVGPFHLDPFSNPRSHIQSDYRCMLENGGDGLGASNGAGWFDTGTGPLGLKFADDLMRVWLQPPYSVVMQAFKHYQHTRWVALLRFDPSTKWFREMYREASLICVPRKRVNFEPPPGVRSSSNTIPHALYYRHAEDVTQAVLRACIAWRPR